MQLTRSFAPGALLAATFALAGIEASAISLAAGDIIALRRNQGLDEVVRVDPTTGAIDVLPSSIFGTNDIATDRAGNVWGFNVLGGFRIDPVLGTVDTTVPAALQSAWQIHTGLDGNLLVLNSNGVFRIDAVTWTATQLAPSIPAADFAVAADGAVWYYQSGLSSVVRRSPTGSLQTVQATLSRNDVLSLVAAADGSIYVGSQDTAGAATSMISVVDATGSGFTEIVRADGILLPEALAVAADREIFVAEAGYCCPNNIVGAILGVDPATGNVRVVVDEFHSPVALSVVPTLVAVPEVSAGLQLAAALLVARPSRSRRRRG